MGEKSSPGPARYLPSCKPIWPSPPNVRMKTPLFTGNTNKNLVGPGAYNSHSIEINLKKKDRRTVFGKGAEDRGIPYERDSRLCPGVGSYSLDNTRKLWKGPVGRKR